MSDIYKFNANVDVHSDCSYSSNVIGTISAGTSLEVTEIANGWYHTNKGWSYGFSGTSVLVEKVGSTTKTDVQAGSYIKFNADDKIKTIDGNYLPLSVTNCTFLVIQTSAEKTQISDGSNTYWVSTSNIQTTANGTISVPPEVAQAATITPDVTYASSESTVRTTLEADSVFDGLRIKSLRGVYGMPYQYMTIADRRIDPDDSDSFGRKYAEKIVSKLPLLIMVPGSPEFLAGYSKKEKENILSYVVDTFTGGEESKTDLDSLIDTPGKYYGLKVNWTEYFNHVNPMCRAAARLLKIDDQQYYGSDLGHYDWQSNSNETLHSMLNYRGGVAFYVNSETQISDSFSNSTGQSMIAGKVNGISDIGREMNFLLGGAGALTGMQLDTFSQDKALARSEANKNDMVSKMVNGNNLMGSITNGLNTVIAGGKLIFPEIWNDSQFSRDYDISLKLTSPDCDDMSIYLNIIVPILHMVGYVGPRSTGPNGYISPFLVRAFYKGMFNCDMGMITNMSINKGQEGNWTPSGLPTVVEIHFTIKELYGTMAITTNENIKKGLLSNITLMDYIGNLCGININEPDIKRTLYMYYSQYFRDKYLDKIYTDAAGGLDQWATNKMLNLFNRK